MMKLCVMASNGYLPALVFHPEQGLNRVTKDSQRLLPNHELRDLIRSSPLRMRPQHNDEPWRPTSRLFDNNQFVKIEPAVTKPVLIDIQDSCQNPTSFTFGVTKQCTSNDQIVKFLVSGLNEAEKDRLDLYSLSDLTGLQTVATNGYKPCFPQTGPNDSKIIYPNLDFDSRKPLMDFVGDLVRRSEITFHEDGRVTLTGTGTEVKDVLSILAEFYLSKSSTNWTNRSMLVPQFNRLDFGETSYGSTLDLETVIVAPLKSPAKIKHKQSSKKKTNRNKTAIKHQTNYIQACESLLSIIFDKKRNGKSAIPVLKKSGPELPNLLTQFSATIAGTGIAVLFSVMCKVGTGRVPFCASKMLNTGLGLGLVWLSWAVNGLRDSIVKINRNSNRKGLKDEEMMKNLDRSLKEIGSRAAALMAVMVLRLA